MSNEISCTKLQLPPEPLTRGLRHQIPVLSVLFPQLNSLNPHPRKKIPGYATANKSSIPFGYLLHLLVPESSQMKQLME